MIHPSIDSLSHSHAWMVAPTYHARCMDYRELPCKNSHTDISIAAITSHGTIA